MPALVLGWAACTTSRPPLRKVQDLSSRGDFESAYTLGKAFLREVDLGVAEEDGWTYVLQVADPTTGVSMPLVVPYSADAQALVTARSGLHYACRALGRTAEGGKGGSDLTLATSAVLVPLNHGEFSETEPDAEVLAQGPQGAEAVGATLDTPAQAVPPGPPPIRTAELPATASKAEPLGLDLTSVTCVPTARGEMACDTSAMRTVPLDATHRRSYRGVSRLTCSNATVDFAEAFRSARQGAFDARAESDFEQAKELYTRSGDLAALETFLVMHPESRQAATTREMVAEAALNRAREDDGRYDISQLEDLATNYDGTHAAARGRGILEAELIRMLTNPPNIVLMIEFLKGPSRRDDRTFRWSHLDTSESLATHREHVRQQALTHLTSARCVGVLRYCHRFAHSFPDDPETPAIRKLIDAASKNGGGWRKHADCLDKCLKKCRGDDVAACHGDCMESCGRRFPTAR